MNEFCRLGDCDGAEVPEGAGVVQVILHTEYRGVFESISRLTHQLTDHIHRFVTVARYRCSDLGVLCPTRSICGVLSQRSFLLPAVHIRHAVFAWLACPLPPNELGFSDQQRGERSALDIGQSGAAVGRRNLS